MGVQRPRQRPRCRAVQVLRKGSALTSPREKKKAPRARASAAGPQGKGHSPGSRTHTPPALVWGNALPPRARTAQAYRPAGPREASGAGHVTAGARDSRRRDLFRSLGPGTPGPCLLPPSARFLIPLHSLPSAVVAFVPGRSRRPRASHCLPLARAPNKVFHSKALFFFKATSLASSAPPPLFLQSVKSERSGWRRPTGWWILRRLSRHRKWGSSRFSPAHFCGDPGVVGSLRVTSGGCRLPRGCEFESRRGAPRPRAPSGVPPPAQDLDQRCSLWWWPLIRPL